VLTVAGIVLTVLVFRRDRRAKRQVTAVETKT
jgi:hypothetical protein